MEKSNTWNVQVKFVYIGFTFESAILFFAEFKTCGWNKAQISCHIFCLPFIYLLLFLGGPEKNDLDQDN